MIRQEFTNIIEYSPSMKNANLIPEYSVWNPATSSDSASARSNGGRLTSASAQIRYTTNAGNCGITFQTLSCCATISDIFRWPLNMITATSASDIATS